MKTPKVTIHVMGGVAHLEHQDAGTEVEILDFDQDGVEEERLCHEPGCAALEAHTHVIYLPRGA